MYLIILTTKVTVVKGIIRHMQLTLKFLAGHPDWLVLRHTCHHASLAALQRKSER